MPKAIMTVKDCLTSEDRPETPSEMLKYRNAASKEPGQRFIHYGLAKDYEHMKLTDKVFGVSSERERNTASDLIQSKNPSSYQQIENIKSERNYKSTKRETLGHTIDRGNTLPDKFTKG